MLTRKKVESLCSFAEGHERCGGRGYRCTPGLKMPPSSSGPYGLTTSFSLDRNAYKVECACGAIWRQEGSWKDRGDTWIAVDDVSIDLTDHLVQLMKRPAMFLGELSATRLELLFQGAEIAMNAMPEKPRFLSLLDSLYGDEKVSHESRIALLPKTPCGLPDYSAYPEFEEQFLVDIIDALKRGLADEYADLLVALIARSQMIAKYYLWF